MDLPILAKTVTDHIADTLEDWRLANTRSLPDVYRAACTATGVPFTNAELDSLYAAYWDAENATHEGAWAGTDPDRAEAATQKAVHYYAEELAHLLNTHGVPGALAVDSLADLTADAPEEAPAAQDNAA